MVGKIFFFFALIFRFHLVSSSLTPDYVDLDLRKMFHKFRVNPTPKTYDDFKSYATKYFRHSPLECLKLINRYRDDWSFKKVFWWAINWRSDISNPADIDVDDFFTLLDFIIERIKDLFPMGSRNDDGPKIKTKLEMVELLVKEAEMISSKLKLLGENERLVEKLDKIDTWKFLVNNFSYDFTNQTVDFHSLFRTFSEINSIFKSSPLNNPSSHLNNLLALFWVYLSSIYRVDCFAIFSEHHRHKALVLYIILEFWGSFYDDDVRFYPKRLIPLFENLYRDGLLQLKPIEELLKKFDPQEQARLYGVFIQEVSSFRKLSHLAGMHLTPLAKWKVRGLAELEYYIFLNTQMQEGKTLERNQLSPGQNSSLQSRV